MKFAILPRLLLLALPAAAVAAPPTATPPGLRDDVMLSRMPERIELEALDVAKLRAEDLDRRAQGKPPRYAIQKAFAAVTPATDGEWESLPDRGLVWRYTIHAKRATSVEPGFQTFRLPDGAALYVHGDDGRRVRGPYTKADNESHGQLWVPIVEGDTATVELVLEPGVDRSDVSLELTNVLQGYRAFWKQEPFEKETENCNIDVACNQANSWRDQVRSAARITVNGGLCSGQMVNNTAHDRRPLFLTANHCGLNSANAPELKVYWNYENSFCRTPGSPASGGGGDGNLNQVQTGAMLLSRYASSDFTLVELDDMPLSSYEVYWSGWDRRDQTHPGGATIHHPAGEEKRISIDNHAFEIIDGDEVPLLPPSQQENRSHFYVVWDQGVTEGGSSGSGLWNNQGRLVGQLHGGASHVCGSNENFDWYGRLWKSWNGGGTPENRLRDHLDPLNTGEQSINGVDDSCNAPEVSISVSTANPVAGQSVTFTAQGGGSGLDYVWDLDGDGVADGTGRQITTRYNGAFQGEVVVSATDRSAQCGAQVKRAVDVDAPDLRIANIGELQELCGDGDGVQEPGERWELPVTIANQGNALASDVTGVFTRTGILDSGGGPVDEDAFGNTLYDSRSSSCPYDFTSISGSNRVQFNASSSFPANDDGGSDPIALQDFPFYGSDVPSVVMSSNGYLATSATRNGGDYSNDCPLPTFPDLDTGGAAGAGRLAAYHDDLITGIAWSQRFADCPRPGNTHGSGACRIFQWDNLDTFAGPIDQFDMQAILYEGTGQIVYQYGPGAPAGDTTPTVGVQDNNANRGLTWGCDDEVNSVPPVRPDPETAVCIFHPQAQPLEVNPDAFEFITPAVSYGDIPAGQNRTRRVSFEISAQAECGDVFGIGLHGMSHQGGFAAGPGSVAMVTVGGPGGQCDAQVACDNKVVGNLNFQRGMWFNPARDGHGVDVHTAGDTGFLTWFTYGKDRSPTWYLAIGDHAGNQIHGDLLRFTEGNVNDPEDVGEAIFTVTGQNSAMFNWTLDGEPGGEPFRVLEGGGAPPAANRTGHWYPPSQNGWGMTINMQGDPEFDIVYFYDDNGDPAWTLGIREGGNNVPMEQFTGTCPDCVWVGPKSEPAGSFTRSFSNARNGTVSTDIDLTTPREGAWQRNNVPIEILSDPVQ